MIKNKMILIGGMPACGKTTLGKELSKRLKLPFLDKDTLCDMYTNYVVEKETFPNDRDSDLYRNTLRNLEYEIMFHVGLEQVELELCPVLVSPFSSEFIDKEKIKELESKLKAKNPKYELITILLEADPETIKKQMIDRGRKEDKTKLADWDNYIQGKINFQEKAKALVSKTIQDRNEDGINELISYLQKED